MEMEVTPLGKIQNFDFFFRVLIISCEDCVVLFVTFYYSLLLSRPEGEKRQRKVLIE